MNLKAALPLSLVISLAFGTACGASPLAKKATPAGATATASTVIITPELQQADARVKQAEEQLNLAKKQLSAARSILKAAEADLKAAKSERQALAMRTQAAGLAEEAGMTTGNNRSLAQAAAHPQVTTQPPVNGGQAVAPLTNSAPAVRTEQMDFNLQAQPAAQASPDAVTPELR